MTERDRNQSVESESCILAGVLLPHQEPELVMMGELEGLAEAAGAHVVGKLMQRRPKPVVATYLGSGKVEELAFLVEDLKADVVIFDNDLNPAQVRNLEQATGAKVLDRTELILDIFASRAQTHESRLAVELAQLEYALPRLKRMWTHLSRLKMGIGMRGPGEKQLEVDRRLVEKRISDLRGELKQIEQRKERQVSARSDHMTVSLVGYTNAGKSSLMNVLTDADVQAKDQLFATLDTRTRRWQLPHWGPVLLSDTVGFVRDLPHHLIASFKATLEESRQADLLLHVADASNPDFYQQVSAVFDVLAELDITEKNMLLVVNKIDAVEDKSVIQAIRRRYPNAIPVSAHSRQGIEQLALAVSDALSSSFRDVEIITGVGNGKVMAYLSAHGEVLSRSFSDELVTMHCRIPQKYLGRIADDADVEIRPCDRTFEPTSTMKQPGDEVAIPDAPIDRDVSAEAESESSPATSSESPESHDAAAVDPVAPPSLPTQEP